MRHLSIFFLLLLVMACQSGTASTDSPAPTPAPEESIQPASAKPAKPRVIGQGATVSLSEERDLERITVFDFTSEYCGPCRQIAPYLDLLHERRPDVAVVKIDINRPGVRGIDWASPTVRQFGISSIPHMKVVDASGTMIAEGRPAWDLVVKWIMELQESTGR